MSVPAAPPGELRAAPQPPPTTKRHGRKPALRGLRIALAIVGMAIIVLAVLWHRFWPFAQQAVLQDLREAGDSTVSVRSFRPTYFPSPGCVLEGVVFRHGTKSPVPLITVNRLTVKGSYFGLIGRRVSNVTAEGLHIVIPPFGTAEPFHTKPSKITVSELVARDAILDFYSEPRDQTPLRFDIHEAVLHDISWSGPLSYRVKVHNPEPPGEVSASGKFGVWKQSDPASTPLSGEYKFEQADLGVFEGISGILTSSGKFHGNLGRIEITGTTDTPDFMVRMSRHAVPLATNFTAHVNAIDGDTFLDRIDARFRKTQVLAHGSVAGRKGSDGKFAQIDLSSTAGRVEDILRLFVKQETSPMLGSITLSARAELPPGDEAFLQKLKMSGNFDLEDGRFSNPGTQTGVNKLSAGARGLKQNDTAEPVAASLTGGVELRHAIGNFGDLDFRMPGAHARVRGTYNLISHAVDFHGQMWLDTNLSNTTSGAKAFVSKFMDPFFKKGRRKGEIVPVHLGGTYEKPQYGLDLNDAKAENVPPPEPRSKAK
jgi:hypothetical protein